MSESKYRRQLQYRLRPVRNRMRLQTSLGAAWTGCWAGSVLALSLAVALLVLQLLDWPLVVEAQKAASSIGWVSLSAIPVVFALLGLMAGWIQPLTWMHVARHIDDAFHLKDRTSTAWEFGGNDELTPVMAMQVDDAVTHLQHVQLADLARFRTPVATWWALGTWALAVLVGAIPISRQVAQAAADRQQQTQVDTFRAATAEQLEDTLLADLQQLAKLTGMAPPESAKLQRLADDVERQLRSLKKTGQNERETLTAMSKMQASISEMRDQLNSEQKLKDLQQLGQILSTADSLRTLNQVVDNEDFDAAAEQLRQWQPDELSDLERQTLAEELEPVSKELAERNQQKLADAAAELSEGLQQSDSQQSASGAQQVAEQMFEQALRMEVQRRLDDQVAMLAAAKGQSQNGGNNTELSEESKETWGRGRAGKPLAGDPSEIESTRQREQLTANHGEGPVEVESTESDQLTGNAQRALRNATRPSRDEIEQALREEALPLHHRRTIRDYFRTLRSTP